MDRLLMKAWLTTKVARAEVPVRAKSRRLRHGPPTAQFRSTGEWSTVTFDLVLAKE